MMNARRDPQTWTDTLPGVIRKSLEQRASARFWERRRLVRHGQQLPKMPFTRGVWAISMVKNEVDILESTIRHSFEQGIDRFLITDNGSTDGTIELLKELACEFPISIGADNEVGYFQDHKMTALAKAARQHGAEWVLPMDADEFWFASGVAVGDFLRRCDRADTRVTATMFNVFPTSANPKPAGLRDGPLRLDLRPHVLSKVATRPHPLLWIGMGNHSALRPGIRRDGLFIAHLPWRSFEQYRQKVRQGAAAFAATDLEQHLGGHWRKQGVHSDDELMTIWDGLLNGHAPGDLGWRPVGPFRLENLASWKTWDPEGVISPLTSQLSEI